MARHYNSAVLADIVSPKHWIDGLSVRARLTIFAGIMLLLFYNLITSLIYAKSWSDVYLLSTLNHYIINSISFIYLTMFLTEKLSRNGPLTLLSGLLCLGYRVYYYQIAY